MSLQGPSRADVLMAAVAALQAAGTLAKANVFARRAWSARPDQYPAIFASAPLETKASQSRSLAGAPTFDASVTISLVLRTTGKPGPTGLSEADAQLDRLCAQVEDAVLTDPGILALVQGIGDVVTQYAVDANGAQLLGEASILVTYVVRQQFRPNGGEALTDIVATRPGPSGAPFPLFDLPIPQGG